MIPYYESGNIGINKSGFIELRNNDGMNIAATAKVRRLIAQDNKTREKLYEEVAASMNIPGSEIQKVEKIFTEVWQKKSSGRMVDSGCSRQLEEKIITAKFLPTKKTPEI